jgi:hypothetical protein
LPWIEPAHELVKLVFLFLNPHFFLHSCQRTINRLLSLAVDRINAILLLNFVSINNKFAAKTHRTALMHFHIDFDQEFGESKQLHDILEIDLRI